MIINFEMRITVGHVWQQTWAFVYWKEMIFLRFSPFRISEIVNQTSGSSSQIHLADQFAMLGNSILCMQVTLSPDNC